MQGDLPDGYESEYESLSVSSTAPYEPEEDEVEYPHEPVVIMSGEGEPGGYSVIPWKENVDERIPIESSYLQVIHRQKFQQSWTPRIVEQVLCKNMGNLVATNDVQKKCYIWSYQIRGCSPRDPNMWQLVIPQNDMDMWQDNQMCGTITVELDYGSHYIGRILIFYYLKSDGYQGGYNHFTHSYSRYISAQEMECLNLPT